MPRVLYDLWRGAVACTTRIHLRSGIKLTFEQAVRRFLEQIGACDGCEEVEDIRKFVIVTSSVCVIQSASPLLVETLYSRLTQLALGPIHLALSTRMARTLKALTTFFSLTSALFSAILNDIGYWFNSSTPERSRRTACSRLGFWRRRALVAPLLP